MRSGSKNKKSAFSLGKKGFTIVELLVVVVVIAILASVTVVAYNGVTNRAKSSRAATVAQQYRQALISYYSLNGEYPGTADMTKVNGSWYYACLGSGYTAQDSTGNPACRWGTSPMYSNSNFNTKLDSLAKFSSNMPATFDLVTWYDAGTLTYGQGVYFGSVSRTSHNAYVLDGKPMEFFIAYYLNYDDGCNSTLTTVDVNGAYYILKTDESAKEMRPIKDGRSTCILPLPQPGQN